MLRGISYIADFVYINKNGYITIEDVKGYRTPTYKLKRQLLLHLLDDKTIFKEI